MTRKRRGEVLLTEVLRKRWGFDGVVILDDKDIVIMGFDNQLLTDTGFPCSQE